MCFISKTVWLVGAYIGHCEQSMELHAWSLVWRIDVVLVLLYDCSLFAAERPVACCDCLYVVVKCVPLGCAMADPLFTGRERMLILFSGGVCQRACLVMASMTGCGCQLCQLCRIGVF